MSPIFPRIKILRRAFMFAVLAGLVSAQEKPPGGVAALAFLAGHWRGPSSSGTSAEEIIAAPEGGVMLSTGREFKDGRCVFYDLVVFAEKAGAVVLIPHPGGKRSPHTFPLTVLDAAAKRAVFENAANDFPKKFTYELTASDHLRITLTGVVKEKPAKEVFELARVK